MMPFCIILYLFFGRFYGTNKEIIASYPFFFSFSLNVLKIRVNFEVILEMLYK